MYFTWDDDKNKRNYRIHGITFETAAKVFNDPHRVEFYDDRHSTDEDRYIVIGMADKILFVIYTERKSSIRLISARLANRREEDLYYDGDILS